MKLIEFSKRGFSDLLKFFIILNNQFHFTNSIISKIMFFMGQLRNSTYIIYHTQSTQSNYNQIYQFIACLSRIQIIAYTQYLFILPFIIIIIFFIAIIYQLASYEMVKTDQIQQKITLKNFLLKQNKLIRMINTSMAFFYQFYDTIAVNFIVEISLMATINSSIIVFIIIIISLTLFCLFMLTKILINNQKLTYIITLISKFQITYLEMIIHFINYVQIGFYCFKEDCKLYQIILSFTISILSFINIFTNFHYMDLQAYSIIIISQSFTLILSITEYLVFIFNFSVRELGIFQFIILPFVICILIQFKNKLMLDTIYKKNQNNLIIFQILYQNLETNNNNNKMPYILYIERMHSRHCKNCQCEQSSQNIDIYLRLITEISHQQYSLKNYQIIQMILVHLFAKNYIQAYSLCSSIIEFQNNTTNEQIPLKFSMKNSASIQIQKINYSDHINKPLYKIRKSIFCYLREESKQFLKARLSKNLSKQYDIKVMIFEEFYKTEYLIRTMNLRIINVLESKYSLYMEIIKDSLPKNEVFHYCYEIAKELHQIEKTIDILYDQNPSMSLLNLKIFYQAEILGNYLQASKEHSVTFEFETQYKQTNIVMLAKQNKVAFIITKLGDCVYNVQIERASSNAEAFFQTELPKYIEPLIPYGIRDFHGENLHDFFQTGSSPRYKQNARLFILQNNYIQIAESYLDSYNTLSELRFINIILEVKDIKGHMIINSKFEVSGINQNLMQMMGFTKQQIDQFNTLEILYGLNINFLIPQFTELIKQQKNIYLVDFYFIKQCYMFDMKKSNMIDRYTNNNLLERYETQIEVSTKYHHNKLAYLILTFDFLKKVNVTSLTSYADISLKSNTKIDLQARVIEGIQVDLPYEFYDNSENEDQQFQPEFNFQQLNSPQERSSTNELLTQQKFFNRYNNSKKESDDVSILKKNFSRQLSMPQLNRSPSKNKYDTLLDVATPLKKTKKNKHTNFEDKIECVNQITNKRVQNLYVKLSVFFLVISSFLGIISLLLQTFLIQNNFNNYITDVGTLPIKNDLMQPMLSFYILRFNIYDKTELYWNGDISLQEFQNKTDFSFRHIYQVYNHFHHHIGELFSSSVLQSLLYDHYYQVKYYNPDTQTYKFENSSARTFLIQYLYYQHFLYTVYANKELPIQSIAIEFQILNHKLFIEICNYLSQSIFDRTIARNYTQVNDQIIVIACFLSVNFICLLFSNYYYRKFTKQRLIFGNMILNIDPQLIEYELQNVNYILDQIENNNISQFYVYDENLKQRQIEQLNQLTKIKQIKYYNKSSIININKFLIFIYSMFFGFLGVNLTNTLILKEFIIKYNPTATVHQNTSELCLNIAMVYSLKELMNNQIFYSYLEDSDILYMKQLLNQSFTQIQNFQIKLLDLDDSTLLFDSNFVEYFLSQQTHNLCPKINFENDADTEQICTQSFDGAFQLGIQSVLNHITKYMISDVFADLVSQRSVIDTSEIYGAFLFTEYLQTASDMAMVDFSNEVLNYKQILETILVTSITFTILLIGIMLYVLESDLKKQLKLAVKFIHLIPRYIIFFDHAFERRIRMQILKDVNL